MTDQITKLKEVLKIVNDGISKKEFVDSFRSAVNMILEMERKVLAMVQNKLVELNDKLDKKLDVKMEDINKNSMDYCKKEMSKMMAEHEGKMQMMDAKMDEVKDGKDADEEMVAQKASQMAVAEIMPQLPKIDDIEKDLPKLGFPIRDALELLQGSDRLNIDAIDGLQELLNELKNKKAVMGGGGFSKMAMDLHYIDDETPTGAVNDVNTDFVLSHAPNPITSLKVYKDGQRQKLTTDYTFSGRTITFVQAPLTGSIITCDYRI